jgi:ABC-type amino acid transport substrate-binding protein
LSQSRAPHWLIIGLDAAPPPPLQFGAPGTPDFRGLEVDLLTAVADALRREPVYAVGLWSELLDRLDHGGLDLVCTAATLKPERRERFAFSLSYLPVSLVLLAAEGAGRVALDSLDHARVGVRRATVADEWARVRLPRATLVHFDLNTDAYRALQRRTVDALIDDRPIARFFVSTIPGLRIVTSIPGTEAGYAMVFSRGNDELRAAVDGILRDMTRSGELERLRREWLREF